MKTAWRVIGTLVLIILAAGIVAAGIGLLTGASADRMVENVFGGWDSLEMIIDVFRQELHGIIG